MVSLVGIIIPITFLSFALGQVYHTLLQEREDRGIYDVAISRLEQISPFPYDLITPHLDKYPNASLLWCQEEPLNNGAWSYVGPRIYTAGSQTQYHKGKYPLYAGREPTSSVATGSKVRLSICPIFSAGG